MKPARRLSCVRRSESYVAPSAVPLKSQKVRVVSPAATAHRLLGRRRIYLAGMALAFDRGWLSVAQVLAYKPSGDRPSPRPWTRGYQYNTEAETPMSGALDWAS